MPKLRVLVETPPECDGSEESLQKLRDYIERMREELEYLFLHPEAAGEDIDYSGIGPKPSAALPEMDGEAYPGNVATFSRGNHVHPTDTSRAAAADLNDHLDDTDNPHEVTAEQVGLGNVANVLQYSADNPPPSDSSKQDTITASGILKGDGAGGVSAAVAGTDYQAPLAAGTDYATPAMIPSVPDPSDATPQALGTAAAGSSGDYSRADHVHGMPSASDVGAAPAAAGVYYGTSDTAAAAQAKTATVPGVTELYDGLRICVWFAHSQNYNGQPTLNVNLLGAKPVNRTPTVAAVRYEWGPGVVDFVYSEASDIWVIVKGQHGGSERYGVVLLSDSVNSSSGTEGGTAATPSAVKAAYDAAISAQDMAAKALGDPAGVNAAVGEYVSYNGGLYTVNTAITSDMAASVFESYLDAVPDGGLNDLNNQTLDGVYSCYGYRADLISTVDVQLKKDYVTDGTTYRIFAPLYLIDFNSPQTVDEYYLMLDQNNPSRFVRVTSNNSARNITSTSFDASTGVLTLTLNGTRRYAGADVRIAKQLI